MGSEHTDLPPSSQSLLSIEQRLAAANRIDSNRLSQMDGIRREGAERHREAMASHEAIEARVLDQQRRDSAVVIGEMDRQTRAAVNLLTQHVDQWGNKLMRALAFCSRNERFDPDAFEGFSEDE